MFDLASFHELAKKWPVLMAMVILLGLGLAAEASAGTYPLARVKTVSERHTKERCWSHQGYAHGALRCEGWDGTGCHRWGLTSPFVNHFQCYQYYFLSRVGMRQHYDCIRSAHYHAPNGARLHLRVQGTSKWTCTRFNAAHHPGGHA